MAPLTRRRVGSLTLLWGAVLVAGCDGDVDLPGLEDREDPDHDVVLGAFVAERELLDLLQAGTPRPVSLRAAWVAAREVHQAHVDLLAAEVGDGEAPAPRRRAPLPAQAGAVLARVAKAERALTTRQAAAAMTARSGDLARVLAAMAAAAAQQSHTFSTLTVPGRRS